MYKAMIAELAFNLAVSPERNNDRRYKVKK